MATEVFTLSDRGGNSLCADVSGKGALQVYAQAGEARDPDERHGPESVAVVLRPDAASADAAEAAGLALVRWAGSVRPGYVERLESALRRIRDEAEDNLAAAVADQALDPKVAVQSGAPPLGAEERPA